MSVCIHYQVQQVHPLARYLPLVKLGDLFRIDEEWPPKDKGWRVIQAGAVSADTLARSQITCSSGNDLDGNAQLYGSVISRCLW